MELETTLAIWGLIGWLLAAFLWFSQELSPSPSRKNPQEGKGFQPSSDPRQSHPPMDEPVGPKPSGLRGQLINESTGESRPLIRKKPKMLGGQLRSEGDTSKGKFQHFKDENGSSKN